MSLTNEEFMKKMKQFSDVDLTLFNETGERYEAGDLRTLTHDVKGIKLQWEMNGPLKNVLPLTHAMIHRGSKVWNVVEIKPITSEFEGTVLELRYDH